MLPKTDPIKLIANLDRALAASTQSITLRRGNGAVPEIESTVKALVRRLPPEFLTDGVNQTRRKIVISPTGLSEWLELPRAGDNVSASNVAVGQFVKIDEPPEVIRVHDVVVRISFVVLG